MSDIPEAYVTAATEAYQKCLGRDGSGCAETIARALMAADEAATKRAAAAAKVVGETFLLDMTAKPDWQDSSTWGRQETIRHIRAAILKGES